MNTTNMTPAQSDAFSWRRVRLLTRLVIPGLKKQLLLFPLFSILTGLSLVFAPFDLTSTCSLVLALAFILAPIGLARRDYKSLIGMLPVTVWEKMVFLMVYFWVVVPVLLYVPFYLVFWITELVDPGRVQILMSIFKTGFSMLSPTNLIICEFTAMALQACVLLVVISSTTNRTMKGIAAGVGSYVGFVFLVAMTAGLYFVKKTFDFFVENPEVAESIEAKISDIENLDPDTIYSNQQAMDAIAQIFGSDTAPGIMLNQFMMCMSAIGLVALVVEMIFVYRKLQKGGF